MPRLVLALVAALAATLTAAVPAHATVVWVKDGDIWQMNDDGSGQQLLISSASVPAAERLGSPHMLPSGPPVVFEGSTTAYKHSGSSHYGDWATGIYAWQNGVSTRLSPAPGPGTGPSAPYVTSRHLAPEVAPNGRYFAHLAVATGCGSLCAPTQFGSDAFHEALDGSDYQDYPTACDSGSARSGTNMAVNPQNAADIVYTSCSDPNNSNNHWLVFDRPTGTPDFALVDDSFFRDPSWSPNGAHVVGHEAGNEPGIWIYDPATQSGRHVLNFSPSDSLTDLSPRFMGNDTILFSDGNELYTIPASCNACPISSATRLTSGGGNVEPAWTSAGNLLPPSGGSGPGGGEPTGGGDQGTDAIPPQIPQVALARRSKLGPALRSGFNTLVTTTEAGAATVDATVSGRDARGLKVAATKVAARGRANLPGAGRHAVRVRFTKKAKKKFRRKRSLKLTLRVAVVDAVGNRGTRTAKVTLRR